MIACSSRLSMQQSKEYIYIYRERKRNVHIMTINIIYIYMYKCIYVAARSEMCFLLNGKISWPKREQLYLWCKAEMLLAGHPVAADRECVYVHVYTIVRCSPSDP